MSVSAWITLYGNFFKTCILIISGPGALFNAVDAMIFLLFSHSKSIKFEASFILRVNKVSNEGKAGGKS